MSERELTYEAAFPGRFLKAALFEGKKPTLTIASAKMEELEGDKGKENKLVLAFRETPKELVCNKTNAFCLKEMFGSKIGAWVGKRVAWHPTTTVFGPKTVDCIRVYGSPDIAADIDVVARIGRRTFKATLHAVKAATNGARAGPPAATPVLSRAVYELMELNALTQTQRVELMRRFDGDEAGLIDHLQAELSRDTEE